MRRKRERGIGGEKEESQERKEKGTGGEGGRRGEWMGGERIKS